MPSLTLRCSNGIARRAAGIEPEARISWYQTGGPRQLASNRRATSAGIASLKIRSRFHRCGLLWWQVGGARGGELVLVDCAGSEWSADSEQHCAKRRREGSEINSSLHALKQCVRLHAERQRHGGKGHVPFRDSLLTRLLSRCFEVRWCRVRVW